jgi:2-polyprenyl-3-methyl-5-hydroxy-6-metoxy-1,4-benzoquinol methylase
MLNLKEFQSEIGYWDREMSLQGDYPEDMKDRITPERMINIYPKCLLPLQKKITGRLPKVLDCGCGAVSMLNYGEENKTIQLTCSDPLAEEYQKLLKKYNYNIKYPMFTISGEKLTEALPENHFDISWIHNALDHSQSPAEVIKEMIKVTSYGGYIIICTWENEGTWEGFHGLHKHNLFFKDSGLFLQTLAGDFGILSPEYNLTKDLPVVIENITITTNAQGRRWIELILKKECKEFHNRRNERNKNFFDSLVNSWMPIYSNPNFPLWGLYALTTNERGYYVKDIINKHIDIKDKNYLDIGTAYGGFPIAFSRECKSVAGFEINEDFLKLAKSNFSDNNLPTDKLYHIDITQKEQLEAFKNSFDVITCNDVIEHVNDVKQAIKNISELLTPGGYIYFEIPNKDYPGFVIKDGHYGLFGITLLPRKDADPYYKEYFKNEYTVGEYYELEDYWIIFQELGYEITYINTDSEEIINKEQVEKDIQYLRDKKNDLLSLVSDQFRGKIRYRLDRYLKNVEVENCYPFWKMIFKKKEIV